MDHSQRMQYGEELKQEDFSRAANLFNDLKHHISILGVLSGVIAGRLFVSADCQAALLTSPQGIFLGGSPKNILFFQEVRNLLAEVLLPNLAARGKRDYVLFYPTDDSNWKAALQAATSDLLPLRSGRMTFTHDLQHSSNTLAEHLVPVDNSLLQRQDLHGLDGVIEEILGGWPSLEAFMHSGFGCVAIQPTDIGASIISWCLTDWVVGTECELGIETDERFRGQGWARRTALGTLALAKQRGLTRVGWQCWSTNIGSQNTALSAGFTLLADFPVLFGWNLPLNNLLVNGNHYMRGDIRYGVNKDYARSAWSYAQALDQGWDWNGDAALYWNAACMHHLIGEEELAVTYYRTALEKGWIDIHQPHYHDYIYREPDSEEIGRILEGRMHG